MTHGHRPPPREYPREWQHGPYQAEPAPQRNGIATAGFVVALVGAVLALIPLVGTVSVVISPVGLILSAVGLFLAMRRGIGLGLSIAGIVLGVVGIIVCAIYAASFAGAVNAAATPSAPPAAATPFPALPSAEPSASRRAPARTTTSTSPAAPLSDPAGSIAEGTFTVGQDIQPGTYKTAGPAGSFVPNCYWARLKDTTGDFDAIIANNNSQGPTTVTIKASDGAFQTNGCQAWIKTQ